MDNKVVILGIDFSKGKDKTVYTKCRRLKDNKIKIERVEVI